MKNKFLPLSLIIIFIIIFIIFYKGLLQTNIYIPEKSSNKDVPMFNAELFYSNKIVKSSEIFETNKFYLLNIWSSWCVPCRQEHPLLMSLKKDSKINIVGMNYKDNKKNAENFLKELGNPYKEVFIDSDGTIAIELGAYGVPESFLIYNNKIIKKYIGPLNQELVDEINLLIK